MFTLHTIAAWCYKVQICKPYFLVTVIVGNIKREHLTCESVYLRYKYDFSFTPDKGTRLMKMIHMYGKLLFIQFKVKGLFLVIFE